MSEFRCLIFNNGFPILKKNTTEFNNSLELFKEIYGDDYDEFEYRMNMNWFILPYKTNEENVAILTDFPYAKFINFPSMNDAKTFMNLHNGLFGNTVVTCTFPSNYIPNESPDYEVIYWNWNGEEYIRDETEGGFVISGSDPVK